ncbi:MAG: lipopolysaccharide/colanic/teichoic acid biosynthesis glycosyltransferase [Patiriisocius sp.]|jgi:lipopolysaccharide/colanic/teichoic acid biosynthesis glycosyltransferase|tara:strand:+ start:1241 stop:1843 length:603 start_codon:yes stop_codon:yes gene_type:complete
MYNNYFKRIIDFIASLIGLVLLFPVLAILSFLLTVANKGKPFFFQIRPGKHEKLFNIIKFKTMTDAKDVHGNLLPDSQRLTRVGSFVRKTSLDEIPQLFNVLKGEMSLIGPRPLLPEYLPLYSDIQKKRHQVCPGVTGLAQVNGRNSIGWEEKFIFDVYYVNNFSFAMDLKVLFLTIKKVLLREGVTSVTSVSMEKFKGN